MEKGRFNIHFHWQPPISSPAAFGVDVILSVVGHGEPAVAARLQTAFDVQHCWYSNPRYGFLCNFEPLKQNINETIKTLVKFHINGLQFYDWQYRHDRLLPPGTIYQDPLGRILSLDTVLKLIDVARARGIAAMPYLAIYGASWDFWNDHQDWGLYDASGEPILFGDRFLGIMNPEAGGDWQRHLLDQAGEVLDRLPFDGLHIDQYGEPKTGFNVQGLPIDLPASFGNFLQQAAVKFSAKPLVFNAVGNWPIEELATSPTVFNYIEIWPPDVRYIDVISIVRNARTLSSGKPTVIALYLHADDLSNILMADSAIIAAGGSRIEIGEDGYLLADPYFPKFEKPSEELRKKLRTLADFQVRYQEWLQPPEIGSDCIVNELPNGVLPIIRKVKQGLALCLVNLADPVVQQWDLRHQDPVALNDLEVHVALPGSVGGIWSVTPDEDDLTSQPLAYATEGKVTRVNLPRLQRVSLIFLKT